MSDNNRVAKDLTAGTIAGFAQVMVGQPFDIVKVRLQSMEGSTSMLECARSIAKNEGPSAFYKGTVMPLLGIGACVSIQFALLEACKRQFRGENLTKPLSSGQLYIAGAVAGLGNSVISGPVEHIRIRLQVQSSTTARLYTGPYDALRKIWATDGMRGLYAGQGITMLREAQGFGAYFLAYEWLTQRFCTEKGVTRKELPMQNAIFYGAMAGYAMWLTAYPFDVLKSRLQTDHLASTGKRLYRNSWHCASALWVQGGIKPFLRGLGPVLIRSPLVNGATFATFEAVMRMIG